MKCGECFCIFDQKRNKNIFNCSHLSLESLPNVPKLTNILIMTNNKVSKIPQSIQKLKVLEIYLSGNPLVCDCEMTWMISWLNTLNNKTNKNLIRDYRDVKCSNSKFRGIPIIFISDVLLGCGPLVKKLELLLVFYFL